MKTILLTAIGGDIAQGIAMVIQSLQRNYRLIGVDIQSQHGGSMYVDTYLQIPSASESDYERAILDIIAREHVDIVIPVSEAELAVWVHSKSLHACDAQIIMPNAEVLSVGLDKLKTNQALAELGIDVPWTEAVDYTLPPSFPCIIKSRLGSGSKHVHILQDSEDAAYYKSRVPNAIYQQLLLPADREVTVAVYRTRQEKVAVFQMLRKLSGGLTSWVEIIDDVNITKMCEQVAHGLNLVGSINIQLRLTDSGPRIFEINPRFSSTTLIRHKFGFEDVRWSLDELEGKEIDIFKVDVVGKCAVRTFDAVILD